METNFLDNSGKTLKSRFLELSRRAKELKILVGYFFLSGYKKVFEVEPQPPTKILVGIGAEKELTKAIENELNDMEDTEQNSDSVNNFIKDLKENKIEIRQTKKKNHSKNYIFNFMESEVDRGRCILGSSNFSECGLEIRDELNYEITNPQDVKFANEHFDKLWEEGVILENNSVKIEKLIKESFLMPKSPYDLYLKALHSIYNNYLDYNDDYNEVVKKKYKKYKFQDDAVNKALEILKNYNGCILGDVVGLGKSIIASKILVKLGYDKQSLILCRPSLMEQWKKYKADFGFNADIESIGKIDNINNTEHYNCIVIDEAHNFRNEKTNRYKALKNICFGKKILLLSATIFNNKLNDIENLLYLFCEPDSNIFMEQSLKTFFMSIKKGLGKEDDLLDESEPSVLKLLKTTILEKIMVRRTKKQINKYYKEEKVKFPEPQSPITINYNFNEKVDKVFDKTIEILTNKLFYARYAADNYLLEEKKLKKNEKIVKVLIKITLVKRLESGIVAFKKTLDKIIEGYERYIRIIKEKSIVPANVKAIDDYEDDIEEYDIDLIDFDKFIKNNPDKYTYLNLYNDSFVKDLDEDYALLQQLKSDWEKITPEDDNKIIALQDELKNIDDKVIIFTESKDTANFIYEKLKSDEVLLITGTDSNLGKKKESIDANFNPNIEIDKKKNDVRILVTTDVMAEGVNLHRANKIINYDLAYNPVVLMQRNGRINRIGSKHDKSFIYNIFPTKKIDKNITNKIKGKINIFLELLGADEKTLTEEEITNWDAFKAEKCFFDDESSNKNIELDNYFLNKFKEIAKNKQELERIKNLPNKIKTCKRAKETNLLTFYKKENAEIYNFIKNGREINVFEGLKLLECNATEIGIQIPPDFYKKLEENKGELKENVSKKCIILNEYLFCKN
ncbi:MAG: phospholipase D-like domain-containing protein [Rickettsiales bacterium]|jgi:superfamily II DNA or RNA helicase|nr:phospholipase D-like domain-containing protein [Rickettsiales bacterium]